MLSYCLNSRKNTEIKNAKAAQTKNGRIMLFSNCALCHSKKSKFLKEEEASGLLTSSRIKVPVSKISLLNNLF